MNKTMQRPRAATWYDNVNAVQTTALMADWLSNRDSLTARLVARCNKFRVQRLSQHKAVCLQDEYAAIGLPRAMKVHEREVFLRCDGEAMVYGHTIVPLTATANEWPLFHALGEKSLGSTLFNDPLVRRGDLSYARLRRSHPLIQRIVARQPDLATADSMLARRSLFWRKGGCLQVTEVFLPGVEGLRLVQV
ncbi:chorismate lyase [Undibacterium sp. TS12]|uniref:chorismate--pyruvate lyase family protein n=1 Tax=Undibacterium sp. TS12 TaxID=2908202 RepID=UPI001F4CC930|nr:chorismate lyase [Undibacterium sp. TS12]